MWLTDWDHNRRYHRLLLRQVPSSAHRVLDVGCGAGTLVRALAARVPHVDGIDRSATMIDAARRPAPPDVTLHRADAMDVDLPAGAYDAVLSLSVLHHLPLEPALARMASWLRPGGVLAVVALPRIELPRELAVEVAASAVHHGLGLLFAGIRRTTSCRAFGYEATHEDMPVADPVLSTREVRERAGAMLPGVRVRRLLLWRYLLTWRKPLRPVIPTG